MQKKQGGGALSKAQELRLKYSTSKRAPRAPMARLEGEKGALSDAEMSRFSADKALQKAYKKKKMKKTFKIRGTIR